MAHILIMPRQGNTVESCIIVDWKVQEGDSVTEETVVCSVETDKAAFEVPAGANGTVLKILRAAGDDVPVLEPIAVIGAIGEDIGIGDQGSLLADRREASGIRDQGAGNREQGAGSREQGAEGLADYQQSTDSSQSSDGNPPSFPHPDPCPLTPAPCSPRARNLAEKEALPLDRVPGTGPGGRVIERDVQAALENRPALTAAAKAASTGALPSAGTGIGGRITSADLASSPPIAHSSLPIAHSPVPVPIKGIRKIIADRMLQSLSETAQFTLKASAPVSRLQDLRSRMKNSAEDYGLAKITVNDLILFAVSRVLPRFSYMNAHKLGDTLKTFEQVHLGMAVDTNRGLMVPVIRNADTLSLKQISSEAKRLASACQGGTVKPEELSGSSFTVTNLGSLGISSFTPVLNFPEVAILGICNIELKPVQLPTTHYPLPATYEPHIGFSLTINHQVVDGAPAARFLKALGETVASIDLLLIGGEV